MKGIRFILFIIALSSFSISGELKNCSTFMLKSGANIFVGHNMDESPDLHVPGMICINKRNIYRESITWSELTATPSDYEKAIVPFEQKPDPKINWISKFGSITFNSEGLDFPDGGINEKGLAIFEMSLGNTQHKYEQTNPTMFMVLWIQYLLDNFSTLDEVIKSAHDINLQGWSWHYFVSDGYGNCAIIEFLNEKVVIYRDQDVVYPILCNARYGYELDRVKDYGDLGGTWYQIRSLIKKPPRFVRAANMLEKFNTSTQISPKDYALEILKEIQIKGWNKWSILVDVNNMIIYLNTNLNREMRYLSFCDFDFSNESVSQLLDIHSDLSGDLSNKFIDYTYERNLKLTTERADHLFVERLKGYNDIGVTADIYAKRFADYSERIRNKNVK